MRLRDAAAGPAFCQTGAHRRNGENTTLDIHLDVLGELPDPSQSICSNGWL